MAQTKRKRKHRGNAAGMVEARGRTSRPATPADRKAQSRALRQDRLNKPPSWSSAINRAGIATVVFIVMAAFLFKQGISRALAIGGFMFVLYVPMGYLFDSFIYKRRQASGKA